MRVAQERENMAKITLNDVNNINSVSIINDNFDKIEAELQDKILYRNNPTGEPNGIQTDLDMNGKRLLNVGGVIPATTSFPAKYFGSYVSNPSLGPDGLPPTSGALYFRTGVPFPALMVFDGGNWVEASPTTINTVTSISPALFASSSEVGVGASTTKVVSPSSIFNSIGVNTFWSAVSNFVVKTFTAFKSLGTGAVDRTIQSKLQESVSFYDFGAIGDGVADDTTAVNNAYAYHVISGTPLKPGKGTFLVSSVLAWDFGNGIKINIKGSGRRNTILKSTYSAGVPFLWTGANTFYSHVSGIGLEGSNATGPILQIGKNDYSDAFNSCNFVEICVNNSSLNDNAEGTRLNYVLQSKIDIVSNVGGTGRPGQATAPGHGKANVIRQACFNEIKLAGGQANVGLYLTNGYTFGNTFIGSDMEEVYTAVKIDSANATRNVFLGGQFIGTNCIDATAGNNNVFLVPNLSPYAGGSVFNGSNNVGIKVVTDISSQAVDQFVNIDKVGGGGAYQLIQGPGSNISGATVTKGTGGIDWYNDAGGHLASVAGASGVSVNYIQLRSSSSGTPAQVLALGDANANLYLGPNGTGRIKTGINNVPNYANDSAAAGGGVQIGEFYRNGSVLMIRVA
jgi:hypothetical protein